MDTDQSIELLHDVYRIFDHFIADFQFHCRKQCALCCTRNVTITTLEAAAMISAWDGRGFAQWVDLVRPAAEAPRLQPVTTINELAQLCAQDAPIPEGQAVSELLACPFLEHDVCGIYEDRPFACRAMVSLSYCGGLQEAEMPELVLTVNNIIMQYIEAIDAHRFSGNMIDVLLTMSNALQRRAYHTRMPMQLDPGLLVNRPISVLMVPPEHREAIQPLLDSLRLAQERLSTCG